MSKQTIAVDFDGVIHRYSQGFHDGTCYDEPMEGAMEGLKKLQAKGYEIVVFTARPIVPVMAWLEKHFDGEPMKVTNTKPVAIAYVDDRAIRFINWKDTVNYF